ncbi:hypothetical protein OM416_20670 [Paenibacillus sp. LS1]|nr:hypothetical protein [Paenibacillus sp. LS1]MCW3794013.1 hypothetical protein [Paenibacillus sp. LS1]
MRDRAIGNGTMHGSGNAPITGSSVAFALPIGDELRNRSGLGVGD